ncbi:MAG: zinc-dependent metalloprotease [Candidatus Eremiobacteraeota bacterium]|nr:zinc-dependent metalloprotease [Candidatus Eremiobacteraeota bacterium]
MSVRPFVAALVCCFLGSAGLASAAAPAPAPSPSGAPAAAAPAAKPPGPGDIPAYDTFVKDAVVQDGLFQLIRKDGKVYMRLGADQLDKDYLQTTVPKNGLGGYGVLAGDVFEQTARIIRFERVGKNVVMLWPHTRFVADPNTPLADAVRASTADSVMGIAGIAAEKKDDKSIVIELSALLGDVMDFANYLSEATKDPMNPLGGYHLDPQRTYFGVSKAFPKNVIVEADQTFASLKPSVVDTVVDPRSIQMHVAYNFAQLPDADGFMPRLADSRVGYFDDAHIAFDHVERMDNTQHFIMRWNLKPSDPSKRVSPALHPIVYTLSNTIPMEYRDPIRRAVLAWNAPFERIGISNAVEVQDEPKDPDYDPEDIRYNVIRWLTESNSGGFAEAQLTWDPRTGQVFRAGVLIDADLVRFGAIQYHLFGIDAAGDEDTDHSERMTAMSRLAHNDGPGAHAQLMYAAVTQALMDGGSSADIARRTSQDFLHAVVLHEVGHDFGLAHNFIGHMAYSPAQIRDKSFTMRNGIASSVMEYNPANVWPKGVSTGTIEQTVLGPYDYHVIQWGYQPVPGAKSPYDEVATLSRWASNWTDPRYRFASDEDVAWQTGHAIDPRVHQFLLTNDALGWCGTQLGLVENLLPKLDQRFPAVEHPYDEERVAFGALAGQYAKCTTDAAHWIGGEYLSRSRRGDPNAEPPLTPVPRGEEKRAFALIDRYVFSNDAFRFDPRTLRRLVYSEYNTFSNFGYSPAQRHDLSVADMAGRVQLRALSYMYAPTVLARLADLPTKAKPGETMTLADLFAWSQTSIYGDIANGRVAQATQVHRNLQRRYATMLRALALTPPPGTPYDAQALAHYELVTLDRDLTHAESRSGLDLQTRAHLSALHDDVTRTLKAQRVIGT